MVQFTLEHMIFSTFLVGFLIFTSVFAIQYAGAQAQAALMVELRNTVLLVKQELLDAYRAANATQASDFVVPLTVPRAIQGKPYSIHLYTNGTLRGVVGQIMFETQLPVISNCVWGESSFRSSGSTIRIAAEYVTAARTVTVSISS
jgi:hypothetical protein